MKQQSVKEEIDYEKELQRLTRKIAKNPNDKAAIFEKGDCLMDLGRLTEAEEVFRYLYTDDPEDVGSLSCIIEILVVRGEMGEACELYDHLLTFDTQHARDVYFDLITTLHFVHEKSEEALVLLDKTIEAQFDPVASYLLKGLVMIDLGQDEQGEYYINLVVDKLRDNPTALFVAALTIGLKRSDLALKLYLEFEKVMTGDLGNGFNFPIETLIASTAYVTEQYEIYLKYLDKACKNDPQSVKEIFGERMGQLPPEKFYAKELRELGGK